MTLGVCQPRQQAALRPAAADRRATVGDGVGGDHPCAAAARGVPLARQRRLDGAQRLVGLTQRDGDALYSGDVSAASTSTGIKPRYAPLSDTRPGLDN